MSRLLSLRALLGASVASFVPALPVFADDVTQVPSVDVAAPPPQAPGSQSTVTRGEINQNPPLAPSDILRDVPGVWTQDPNSPGLSISIRGLSDFGRVNVMIDGARQNFQSSGHNANGTVFIDPALLAGVDVSRGTVTGTNGAGAIAGVVNLRTIGVDDIVPLDKKYGVQATLTGGTNHYDFANMVALGVRANPQVGVVGAFSMRNSGNYNSGDGTQQPGTAQKLYSGLIKFETRPGVDQTLNVGGIFYSNNFGGSSEGVNSYTAIESNTVTVKYSYQPTGNPWVNLNAGAYYTDTNENTNTDAFYGTSYAPAEASRVKVATFGGTLDNTSHGDLGPVNVAVTYGGEYFHDSVTSSSDVSTTNGQTPQGDRGVGGGFVQATATWGIVSLIPGVRVDTYHLTGSGTNTYPYSTTLPYGPFNVDKSATGASPKVTLAVRPITGLELYGSYGNGWRPPALTETLWSGAHPGLSFIRFIPNPTLDPETTNGYEFGVKLAYADVLLANDKVNVKADYFHTNIDDYIAQTLVVGRPASGRVPAYLYTYENIPGTTTTEGFELEISYDSGPVFGRLAYTNVLTSLPGSAPVSSNGGQVPTTPPRNVFSTTLGVRLFDQKLTLGTRVTAVSESKVNASTYSGASSVPGYAVVDLFGQYKLTEQVQLFANIQNIGNNTYRTDVLSPTYAPGLTALMGVKIALGYN
ncbi:TonB-dependent receptor domain-containing protein [Rhodopila sp.]|uniref:TonB-dependent receptor domain-containing protein n=1 Tax=Rhodopila sp. TaxID=2480087 RepID=UPI002CC22E11|nr:TonB-dependent receptor [Rhodopila sp.]HVZ08058.1 TonB-dependent receptor [Rhodopila sp.]